MFDEILDYEDCYHNGGVEVFVKCILLKDFGGLPAGEYFSSVWLHWEVSQMIFIYPSGNYEKVNVGIIR